MRRIEPGRVFSTLRRQLIFRHLLLCLCIVPVGLLLSRPEVILLARLGSVVWYEATALSLALMLAVSPWYLEQRAGKRVDKAAQENPTG